MFISLDVSVLGVDQAHIRAQTVDYHVADNLFKSLISRPDIRLRLVTHVSVMEATREFVNSRAYLSGMDEVGDLASLPADMLLHSPFLPLRASSLSGPRVLTIYDLIPIKFPHLFEFGEDQAIRNTIASLAPDDFITAISESTKTDLLAYAPHIPAERIVVTPLAADAKVFFPCRDPLERARVFANYQLDASTPYLLSVATLEPRKNIAHLIRAFVCLLKEDPSCNLNLVLVGTKGWKFDTIFDELSLAGDIRNRIILTGFVPDADMAALYSNAMAFAYPSLYEGFGLPPLEAMQCGTPVITSNNSSLPEVVGDAGIMVPAQDEEALVDAIRMLYSSLQLRESLSQKGLSRAATFTWERCVDQTIATYKMAYAHWHAKTAAEAERSVQTPTMVIDGVFFQRYQTGVARVWRSLLREWAGTDFGKRLLVLDREKTAPRFEGLRYIDVPAHDFDNVDADRVMLQKVCDENHAELFISTMHTLPLTTPSVFMAHDMIPELSGLDFINKPHWRERHLAIRYAHHFLAVSHNTANDLRKYFPQIAEEQITVAHCGVDFKAPHASKVDALRRAHGITKPYFLLVGERRAYKNAVLFFKAFEALGPARSRYDIVCTGNAQALEDIFAVHVGAATVHMLQLSDEELQAAYAGAQALVYPSKYEGFGMPVIEAMACECPVITSRNSSLLEVAGDAAIYVDPDDVRDMTRALKQLKDKAHRNRFIAAGRRRASLYSWRKMADKVRTTLEELASKNTAAVSIAQSREQALGSALQLHQSGQLEQAVAIYLRLLSADANDFVALHLLGVARNQQGDSEEAVRLLERAIAVNQLTPEAHYNLGNAYLAQGRQTDAHAAFSRALSLNPQFELARNQLNALTQKQ